MRNIFIVLLCTSLVGCAPSVVNIGSSFKPAGKIEAQKVNDTPVSFSVSGVPEWLNGGKGISPQQDTIMCSAFPLKMKAEPGLSATVKAMLAEVFSKIVDRSQSSKNLDFQVVEATATINGGGSEPLVGYRNSLVGVAKIVLKLQVTDRENNVLFKKTVEGESTQPLSGRSCPTMYNQMGDVMKQAIEQALSTLAETYFNTPEFRKI